MHVGDKCNNEIIDILFKEYVLHVYNFCIVYILLVDGQLYFLKI